ncbi:MAG: glutathione S-transferase family protein [Paracoccaceae bacterium]
MILVGQYDSPVTRRVAVTLHQYGIPFTRDASSIFGDAAHVKTINPLTRVPALILDDGEVLIDSGAIIDYLDEQVGPARALIPPHGPDRRRIMQATALAYGCFEKVGILVYEHHFHPPAHVSTPWVNRCEGQLASGLAALEARTGDPWLYGDGLTHADVMIVCTIGYMNLRLQRAFPPGAYPRLTALATACEALPPFIAARISPDETLPSA